LSEVVVDELCPQHHTQRDRQNTQNRNHLFINFLINFTRELEGEILLAGATAAETVLFDAQFFGFYKKNSPVYPVQWSGITDYNKSLLINITI